MVVPRISLLGLLCFATTGNAQSWLDLRTLSFSPYHPVETLPLAKAVAHPASPVPSQSTEQALLDRIRRQTTAIEAEQLASGENSENLLDDLIALADAHRQLGDHAEALTVLDRAQHIIRMHEGLYALEQVDVVESMIENLTASSGFLEALPHERYLLELAQRHRGDARVVDLLTDIADRQMAAASYFMRNDLPPVARLTVQSVRDARWTEPSDTLNARQLASMSLFAARRNYGDALRSAIGSEGFSVADLLEIEDRIIDSIYFEAAHADLLASSWGSGRQSALAQTGLGALEASLENSRRFPGTPEAIGRAMVELADWRMLIHSHRQAMNAYREAYAYMSEQSGGSRALSELLSPPAPIALPAFSARFIPLDPAHTVSGWFDVELALNRYGRVRSVEIVGRSPAVTDDVERRFREYVHESRFRPRFVAGELVGADEFSVRYYFAYESTPVQSR